VFVKIPNIVICRKPVRSGQGGPSLDSFEQLADTSLAQNGIFSRVLTKYFAKVFPVKKCEPGEYPAQLFVSN
jgi:hypothetical protein